MQTRRRFLKVAAGSALALGLKAPSFVPAQAEAVEWRNRQSDMAYRRLGRTGFMVSEIVMGGNEIRPDNCEHIYPALERGLNYLDTAPVYGGGQSEQGYAKVIQSRPRDQFFLNSKISLWDIGRNQRFREIFDSLSASEQTRLKRLAAEEIEQRGAADADYLVNYFRAQRGELDAATLSNVMEKEYGRRIDRNANHKQLILDSVDASLTRLQTDHLDIVMCPHGASSAYELLNYPEVFEAFEILKKAGKVRHLGVSAHTDPAGVLEAAVQAKVYSVAMVAYNVINHARMADALAAAHDNDLGVIAMKVARPVYPGANRGPGDAEGIRSLEQQVGGRWNVPQKAYLWALRNPNLSAVIANMVDASQVEDNIKLPVARQAS